MRHVDPSDGKPQEDGADEKADGRLKAAVAQEFHDEIPGRPCTNPVLPLRPDGGERVGVRWGTLVLAVRRFNDCTMSGAEFLPGRRRGGDTHLTPTFSPLKGGEGEKEGENNIRTPFEELRLRKMRGLRLINRRLHTTYDGRPNRAAIKGAFADSVNERRRAVDFPC